MCGSGDCQRERHRRACARWREANAGEEHAEKLRLKVVAGGVGDPPEARLQWEAVRDAVGPEVAVILRELVRHHGEWVRDAVAAHPIGILRKCGGLGREGPRDAIETSARGP